MHHVPQKSINNSLPLWSVLYCQVLPLVSLRARLCNCRPIKTHDGTRAGAVECGSSNRGGTGGYGTEPGAGVSGNGNGLCSSIAGVFGGLISKSGGQFL